MRKADTTIDALHPHRVLLVLVEAAENVQELGLGDARDQLDHIVEDNGGLLANLWGLILRNLVVHCYDLLLIGWAHVRVDDGEELNGGEFRREAVTVHQALDHAHDPTLEVSYLDHL